MYQWPTSTSLDDIVATLSSTVLDPLQTSIPPLIDSPFNNATSHDDIINPDEGSYLLNTFIGLLIVLLASVLNALGLNLTKLDHVRQRSIPRRERRKDWMRILWLSGMGIYIASQVFGSPLALRYLRPDWVAPLGASSLIFNFMFAYWLVGTPVTSTDIRGTAVIVIGVFLIMVFSSINHGLQQSISVERLNSLWTRGPWLGFFFIITILTSLTYLTGHLLSALLASRASYSPLASPRLEVSRQMSHPAIEIIQSIWRKWKHYEKRILETMETTLARAGDGRLQWLEGIAWAVTGGSLAGLCLVFTKAVVKTFGNTGHPMVQPSALITLLLVVATAIFQIICLNRALQCADTVVVVPLFYAGYTVFGHSSFVNALIFYDEVGQYARWVLFMIFFSISVLVAGVILLSLKSSANTASDPYTVSAQPGASMRLRPRQQTVAPEDETRDKGDTVREREDVLWEVGSISDSGDEAQPKRVGASRSNGQEERRGLLGEEGELEHTAQVDDVDGFGDYETVVAHNPNSRDCK